jgi:DHA1 family bicyclomycin/chloramphenicol resistance-like MFS transporter
LNFSFTSLLLTNRCSRHADAFSTDQIVEILAKQPLLASVKAPFSLLVAMAACGTLGMHVIVPALPATARALNMSISTAQLTITLYLVGLAAGQLLYGPVSDRYGRRPVLLAGLSLFTAASIATVLAPGGGWLIGARILQSIGGCAGLVLGRAAVRDAAAPDKAAGQLALLGLVLALIPSIAPAIGGYVTAFVSWRGAYALLAVFGGLTLLACAVLLPETLAPQTRRPAGSMAASYLQLLRSAGFAGYSVGGACTTAAFYGFISASPFIFERHLHQPAQNFGLFYFFLMGGVALGSVIANRMARRVSLMTALRAANALSIAGAALFALADATDTLTVATVVGPVTLVMVGVGLASPFALAGAVSANPSAIGAASGLYGFIQMGYGMLCTVVVEVWHPGAVYPVVAVLLGSAVFGQAAMMLAARAERYA